jgi:2-C-methyl-D-erythritol 4-phosphate cytidylyltransferase
MLPCLHCDPNRTHLLIAHKISVFRFPFSVFSEIHIPMKTRIPRASGLIVAAGGSRRMGFDKITAPLAGRPLVTWSLAAFEACDDIGPCALVCAESRLDEFAALAAPYKKFQRVVAGGAERADSVLNGLRALESCGPGLVAVHDAARPLVTTAILSLVVAAAAEWGSAVAAEPVRDSLHRADAAGHLVETVSREGLWAMQTPQVAGLDALRGALESAKSADRAVTDEISALIQAGLHPKAVFHGNPNFKVTFPRDLALAEALLGAAALTRIL